MKTYKYWVYQSEFHGGDYPQLLGKTNSEETAYELADCGECRCGGGRIMSGKFDDEGSKLVIIDSFDGVNFLVDMGYH